MRPLQCAVLVGLAATSAAAGEITLYDNGHVVDSVRAVYHNHQQYTVYDDFVLAADSTVSGFRWSQWEAADRVYSGSSLSLFAGDPSTSTAIATLNVAASRVSNGLRISPTTAFIPGSDDAYGFDYSARGLSLPLLAGTYYVGFHSSGADWAYMANAISTPRTEGFYQSIVRDPGPPVVRAWESKRGATAFRVVGTPVPLPPAAWMGLGLLAGVGVMRRLRQRRRA